MAGAAKAPWAPWLARALAALGLCCAASQAVAAASAADATAARLPVVALDAGHGGGQSGAMGSCGLREKDLTLALARRVAALLELSGRARPLLLRDADATLSLDARAHAANRAGAALLVSIHANSSLSPVPAGTETFFLSHHAADRRLAPLVARENDGLPTPVVLSTGIERVLAGLTLDAAHAESQALALRVQRELGARLHSRGRGVLQAPFMVLRQAHMAAVLVEVGFISSPGECRLLRTAAHQDLVAEALATAILGHLFAHDPAVASAQAP